MIRIVPALRCSIAGTGGANEFQRYHDYHVTAAGRVEANRLRRRQREEETDAALDLRFPILIRAWMNEGQRRTISTPLTQL